MNIRSEVHALAGMYEEAIGSGVVEHVKRLVDAGELQAGREELSNYLFESRAGLTNQALARIHRLAELVGIESDYLSFLNELL